MCLFREVVLKKNDLKPDFPCGHQQTWISQFGEGKFCFDVSKSVLRTFFDFVFFVFSFISAISTLLLTGLFFIFVCYFY